MRNSTALKFWKLALEIKLWLNIIWIFIALEFQHVFENWNQVRWIAFIFKFNEIL